MPGLGRSLPCSAHSEGRKRWPCSSACSHQTTAWPNSQHALKPGLEEMGCARPKLRGHAQLGIGGLGRSPASMSPAKLDARHRNIGLLPSMKAMRSSARGDLGQCPTAWEEEFDRWEGV
ncbi:hypothetical protein Droror1_Dr00021725 [Drosera rotundifolia]